jgi:hypothetical protein
MRCCAWDVSEEIVRILQEVEDEMVDILGTLIGRTFWRLALTGNWGLPISAPITTSPEESLDEIFNHILSDSGR